MAPVNEDEWIQGSDIAEVPIDWLWRGWLPRGVVALLESLAKVGKSTVARDLVARHTTGRPWPGTNEHRAPENALWLSTEEHAGQQIVPGLRVAGADTTRVTLRRDLAEPWSVGQADALERLIVERGITLVVIDALKDVLELRGGKEDEIEVRAKMLVLQGISSRTGCVFIGLRHWRKSNGDAMARGVGTVAYGAIAASIIALVKRADGSVVVARAGGRFGADPPALVFTRDEVDERPVIVWGDALPDFDVDAAARGEEAAPRRRSTRDDACAALRELLADGLWHPCDEITAEVRELVDCSEDTVTRARTSMGVKWQRVGFGPGGRMMLRLPRPSAAKDDDPGAGGTSDHVSPYSAGSVRVEVAEYAEKSTDEPLGANRHTPQARAPARTAGDADDPEVVALLPDAIGRQGELL